MSRSADDRLAAGAAIIVFAAVFAVLMALLEVLGHLFRWFVQLAEEQPRLARSLLRAMALTMGVFMLVGWLARFQPSGEPLAGVVMLATGGVLVVVIIRTIVAASSFTRPPDHFDKLDTYLSFGDGHSEAPAGAYRNGHGDPSLLDDYRTPQYDIWP